jgi:UDP-3-O-[3-hydroxymyristoyl] glucosamine N-acyltransferase
MELTVEQIAGLLGGKVRGDGSRRVHTLAKIEEATPGSLSFLSNVKYEPFLQPCWWTKHSSPASPTRPPWCT